MTGQNITGTEGGRKGGRVCVSVCVRVHVCVSKAADQTEESQCVKRGKRDDVVVG